MRLLAALLSSLLFGPLLPAAVLAASAAQGDAEMIAMLRSDAERHERGDGVVRDAVFAAALYCRAARLGDAESHYHLGWMYAYGRGVPRHDGWAAYLLQAAAAQGIAQAPNLLRLIGTPPPERPDCLREPVVAAATTAPEAAEPPILAALEAAAPKPIVDLVARLAPEFDIEPWLALAIIKAESNFDPKAVSPKNAIGLMQLIPATAERFAVRDPSDAKQNVRGGLAYLRWLLAYFEGDLRLVAAAYNAGERSVERHLGVPPYKETRAYVDRILATVGRARHPFDPRITAPSPQLGRMTQR